MLLAPFRFHDHVTGTTWTAPAGTYIDGASIPRFFWRVCDPYVGSYRLASVVHDRACQDRLVPSWEVHEMFYHAMLANGTRPVQAWLMWKAVAWFGPKFKGKKGVV